MSTLFFRLLQHEDKSTALVETVDDLRSGQLPKYVYAVNPESFGQVPGSPFAYWVSDRILKLFLDEPPLESEGRQVRAGLQTSDDFRFVRTWWEVSPCSILDASRGPNWRTDIAEFQSWCRGRTFRRTPLGVFCQRG
jgi:hypothetical protein